MITITLETRLADIAREYADPEVIAESLERAIGDSLDAIGEDLIDTREVGEEWGLALWRVLRSEGAEGATVRDLRDALRLGRR